MSQHLDHATFPAPASSNPACGVTALGFPVDLTPSFMQPMIWQRFQNGSHSEPDNRHTIPGFDITSPYSTCSNQSPCIAELASNVAESSSRPSSHPSPQVLQTNRRFCHFVFASHCWIKERQQQGPLAPQALLWFSATTDPSATLWPSTHFPASPVIRSTLLQRFLAGARRASPVA